MNIFSIMAAPFAECMVLVAIHTYLGIHVLKRRVIFVDLALAQTAALGTTVGFLFGILPDTGAALIFSMLFTFVGAAIFALTRIKGERVPQEAVIGLFYAIMAASAVLVVQKTQGAEHMDDILVGSLLWVKWRDVGIAAAAYGVIGLVHYLFRRQFFLISESPDEAYRQGVNVKAWDFLFYLTFGFVISFSVRVAGVLLVFVFLVAPAIMAFIVTNRLKPQLIIGWTMGTVVTVLGLFLSYKWDLPSGPTVVAFYGVILVIGALGVYLFRAKKKGAALRWIGVGSGVAAAVVLAIWGLGTLLERTTLAQSEAHHHVEETIAADERAFEAVRNDAILRAEARVVKWLEAHGDIAAVSETDITGFVNCADDDKRMQFIEKQFENKCRCALPLLAYFLSCDETPVFFKSEGAALLHRATGKDCGFDPENDPSENLIALQTLLRNERRN